MDRRTSIGHTRTGKALEQVTVEKINGSGRKKGSKKAGSLPLEVNNEANCINQSSTSAA